MVTRLNHPPLQLFQVEGFQAMGNSFYAACCKWQIMNVWSGESFLLNNYGLCGWRKWSAWQSAVWKSGHTQVRHHDRASETRRSVLGYIGRACQCQTDQLSVDQCSSQCPLLGRSQVINWDGSTESKDCQVNWLYVCVSLCNCGEPKSKINIIIINYFILSPGVVVNATTH